MKKLTVDSIEHEMSVSIFIRGLDGEIVQLPKSKLIITEEKGKIIIIELPNWLADKHEGKFEFEDLDD